MRLKNKIALITGASRGIGKAAALLFAKEGASIVLNYYVSDYEPDALENANKVLKELEKIGVEAIKIEADVSKEQDVKKMIEVAIKKFGRIDILVNNAGIVYDVSISDRSFEQWKRTIDTNLLGTYLCSKFISKYMLKNKFGKIINLTSTNAINSFSPHSIDYDASKAGIISLTKNFAKELAPKVQVNAIAPGWVDTEMNKDLQDKFIKDETKKIYLQRFAKPDEIAKAILFLAGDDASYITGSVLVIDGGHD
ncbi:MAG: glucose 1-dehydrogenase [Patescibacteria group bacterium]